MPTPTSEKNSIAIIGNASCIARVVHAVNMLSTYIAMSGLKAICPYGTASPDSMNILSSARCPSDAKKISIKSVLNTVPVIGIDELLCASYMVAIESPI